LANAYSILHNYDRPLYTPNYELIATAMQYKQGKLDANRARLQTVADQIGFADVAKQQDKDYIENRLQSAVDIANKYAALDLSSSSLTNQLIGKVSEVVDDNVKNAVLSTKVYRSEQAEWAKKQEEEPDLYSEDNYQYAMRGANAWLNDEKVGTKYNGGGGFIAYDNYGKRVQDNIINIAKQLEAEWVVQENGSGMFIDNVTKKAVDRGRLEAAIDAVIGDSGRQQMSREAWNRSRFTEDETLKAEYDARIAPQVDEADRYIVNLKSMISKETDKNKIAEYQANLDSWKNRRNLLESQGYDSLGKENAFYVLHSEKFKDNFLNAYSYGPLDVKREVDQNHVKTIEFQEKVREFELNYEMKQKEFELKQKEFDLKEKKTMFDMGIDPVTGKPMSPELIPTETSEVFGTIAEGSGAYSEMNVLDKFNEQVSQSVTGLSNAVGKNLKEADLLAISEQVSTADIEKGVKKTVKNARGEEVVLDFSNKAVRDAYMKFHRNVVETPPEMQAIYNNVETLKNGFLSGYLALGEVPSNLPIFTKKIFKMSDGNYGMIGISKSEGNEYYRLLSKVKANGGGTKGYNSLKDEEKKTLDLYVYSQMMIDEKTPTETKKIVFNKMRKDLVSTVGWNGLGGFPSDFSDWNGAGYKIGSAWTILNDNVAKGFIKNSRGMAGSIDQGEMISDKFSNYDDYMKDLTRLSEEAVKSSSMLPTAQTYQIPSSDPKAKAIKQFIGQGGNKNNIEITFELDDNGKPTGAVYYGYYEYDKKLQKNVFIEKKENKLSKETAESLGIKASDTYMDFDASKSGSQSFSLGNTDSEVFSSSKERAQAQYGVLPMDDPTNIENILNIAYSEGGESMYNKINNELRVFHNMPSTGIESQFNQSAVSKSNSFNVELKPRDGQYYLDLIRGGTTVYSQPMSKGFTSSELSDFIYNESFYLKHALYNQYLNSLIGSDAAKSEILKSEKKVQQLLSNY
jgi:hypothetical protein